MGKRAGRKAGWKVKMGKQRRKVIEKTAMVSGSNISLTYNLHSSCAASPFARGNAVKMSLITTEKVTEAVTQLLFWHFGSFLLDFI